MRISVREWERVVLLRDGRIGRELGPGRHRARRRRTELHRVDVRERQHVLAGQEILTADSIALKVSTVVVWQVADAAAFLTVTEAPLSRLHTAVQLAIRTRVAARPLDELLADREGVVAGVAEEVTPEVAPFGLRLVSVVQRDLMLPAEVRRAVAQVLLAREQGKAELERARAEAAALRSLANTARLLEQHPSLLHLRTLQAAGTGATLVVTPAGQPVS